MKFRQSSIKLCGTRFKGDVILRTFLSTTFIESYGRIVYVTSQFGAHNISCNGNLHVYVRHALERTRKAGLRVWQKRVMKLLDFR